MPPKGKADNTAYQKLKKDIKEGTISTLYVFHGEEAYLRDFYLGQMKKKAPARRHGGVQPPHHEREGV